MPKDKRPLPKPPKTPFERKGAKGGQEGEDLVADKMSIAMAKGKLDSFIEKEFDGNENAAKLASMMIGMTGMGQGFAPPVTDEGRGSTSNEVPKTQASKAHESETPESGHEVKGIVPSEEIMKATMSGDVKKLTALLKEAASKHGSDMGNKNPQGPSGRATEDAPPVSDKENGAQDIPFMEKQLLEKLINMASENNVSVDWLMQRALKLYIQDYQNTGRM
jgi:hypothetical protein